MPRSALVVGSVDRASEGAAKECEALLDALESLSLLLADAALLVDEGAAVDEAVVATALGSSALVLLPPPTTVHQPNEQACDNHEYHNGCDAAANVNNLGVSFVLWRTHAFTLLGTRRVML